MLVSQHQIHPLLLTLRCWEGTLQITFPLHHIALLRQVPSSPHHWEDNGRQEERIHLLPIPGSITPAMHFTQQPQPWPQFIHLLSSYSQNHPRHVPLRDISTSRPAPPSPSLRAQLCSFFSKLLGSNNPDLVLRSPSPKLPPQGW